ncbi:MAG: hypothetical protein ACYC27_20330 [Armatimonadota bacterium]
MRRKELQTDPVRLLLSACRLNNYSAGIGIYVENLSTNNIEKIYEPVRCEFISDEHLYLIGILWSLQFSKKYHTNNIEVLCPNELSVNIVNRDVCLEPGSVMVPTYVQIRALMHTYESITVRTVSEDIVEPASKIACRCNALIPAKKMAELDLYTDNDDIEASVI